MVGAAIAAFSLFSSRTFVSMADYSDMNQDSRLALDKMSKDIRQARLLTSYSSTNLNFLDINSNSLQFVYNSHLGQLQRISGGQTTILLSNCDALSFYAYQHTMKSNTFHCYKAAGATNARVIDFTWSCSRKILGKTATTENDQAAEIVMRNH